ncbi:MAG: DUF3570 domain-containing protein [Gammaproteobacteria bacterium]|nr:DUF3570 domain-containing protein [Gammaproteobacteria bacterium]
MTMNARTVTRLTVTALGLACIPARAAILPEDRADVLYHYYDGGGVQIDGPSILVRKKVGQSVSFSANYYVDTVSSASIDVVTRASPYSEERTELSLGADYLRGDTTLSLAVTQSDENDYRADTLNLGIAQEVFGGLTTVSMGYTRGSDDVGMRGSDQTWAADHWRYRVGISQVVTRNLLVTLDYEAIGDEGLLNNPYREVRYADAGNPNGYDYQPEVYPNTRDSNAVALRARYFLPYRAAVSAGYRWFNDSWGIAASTVELGYTHPHQRWTWDVAYRYYTQDAADFYSDLFPYVDAQNFMARDKELSTFASHGIRLGVGYELPLDLFGAIDRGSVNLVYDHLIFSYDDFRDLTATGVVGAEPLYEFDADILQLFFSVWF